MLREPRRFQSRVCGVRFGVDEDDIVAYAEPVSSTPA